eukprot:CAMPEP_0182548268 /NCGR_PEP_ID=MMETSP1323-20130603/38593_1 /TAXON_ID=236787 /ORGANISM="Florenciella parvula, Strain RCC1693" /LENGTH=188 /DNA_ID=CAMNT_0024759651 /DNA_START=12 /DNA_END=578 /DNA_ORIENTATION=+
MVVSMAYSLGSIGGLSLGNVEVADHQRLSGAGYCFSASAPPFVSTAASMSLACLSQEGTTLMKRLQDNVTTVLAGIETTCKGNLAIVSHSSSPIIHLALAGGAAAGFPERSMQMNILEATVEGCKALDLLITTSKTVKGEKAKGGKGPAAATLRIAVRASMDKAMLTKAIKTIDTCLTHAIKFYKGKQ